MTLLLAYFDDKVYVTYAIDFQHWQSILEHSQSYRVTT